MTNDKVKTVKCMMASCTRKDPKDIDLFVIKDGDNRKYAMNFNALKSKVKSNGIDRINIINLRITDTSLDLNIGLKTLQGYADMESSSDSSIESDKAYAKSALLDMCPSDESGIIKGKLFENIVITDNCNKIQENIRAKEITFIGDKNLYAIDNGSRKSVKMIRCKKAVIKNKCVMSCLNPGVIVGTSGIMLEASEIIIAHNYIDISSVYELLWILRNVYGNLKNDSPQDYFTKVVVDFAKSDVQEKELKSIVTSIIYKALDRANEDGTKLNFATYLAFACSMYMSTWYREDYYIELAEICHMFMVNKFGKYWELNSQLNSLKHLYNYLQSLCDGKARRNEILYSEEGE